MNIMDDGEVGRREPLLLHQYRLHLAGDRPSLRYAGWLLARFGATVSRVAEPVDSALDLFLNDGIDLLDAEPATADAVLLCRDSVCRAPVRVRLEAWGAGERSDWPGEELLLAAAGGLASYTRGPDQQPVYGFGRRLQYLAGTYAATAAVAGLLAGGTGHEEVVVNEHEVVASILPYATLQYAYNGSTETVEQSGPRFTCRTRDGHVVIYSGGLWLNQAAMLVGAAGSALAEDERFVSTRARFSHVAELAELFERWCLERDTATVMREAETWSVAVAPARGLDAVLEDPQLRHSHAWRQMPNGGVGPQLPVQEVPHGG